MKIIAFSNQKGGTGKTTVCVNIAAALVREGERVLVIDLDPQGNATVSVGVHIKPEDLTISEFLLHSARLEDVMVDSYLPDLSVVPSDTVLAHIEVELISKSKSQFFLKKSMENSKDVLNSFDFVFIDCPPSLSLLTVNGLCTSDFVIIPVLCDYLSLEGLSHIIETVDEIKSKLNPSLKILGILPNMIDRRLRITEESISLLRKEFGDKIFRQGISTCSRLREAPSFGKAIFDYATNSVASDDFLKVAREMKRRIK
ncbi:MAG: AAA family ATPase [Candidatus Ratteibacteria bacterium]|nr:AAA family ATPase [Candidatus Ratteibacteria bacterium]